MMTKENETRCIFWFKDSDNFVNLKADEFHEDEGYLKAYYRSELVGMFLIDTIKAAYRTETH